MAPEREMFLVTVTALIPPYLVARGILERWLLRALWSRGNKRRETAVVAAIVSEKEGVMMISKASVRKYGEHRDKPSRKIQPYHLSPQIRDIILKDAEYQKNHG